MHVRFRTEGIVIVRFVYQVEYLFFEQARDALHVFVQLVS